MGTAFEALADLITGLGPELSNQPRARELGDKLVRMARAQRAAITTAPAIIIEFIKLLKSFVREVGPPSSTADFCARVNGMITLIVREITGADCVFIRRLNSDGSVELLGEPKWYDGQEVGRPPRIKFKDEGVSARILNRADPCPVVIWNIHAPDTEDAIRTSHRQMLDRYARLAAAGGAGAGEAVLVHDFLTFIKAEVCIPLTIKGRTLGGIVAVNGQPYLRERAAELGAILTYWQDVLSFLYFMAYHLDDQERRERLLSDVAEAIPWVAAAVTDDEFLRRMATLLTCHAGLGWHRALVFLFQEPYPADARCFMAIGGPGKPEWSARQDVIRNELAGIKDYMRKAEDPDYARGDVLFEISQDDEDPLVIAGRDIEANAVLHALLIGTIDAGSGYRKYGSAHLTRDDPWLRGLSGARRAFPATLDCEHYIIPLIRSTTHEALGFVILDTPYAHRPEHAPDVTLTLLVCQALAGYMADRGLGVRGWYRAYAAGREAIEVAEAALADYERDPRGVRCAVYERFPELGCR